MVNEWSIPFKNLATSVPPIWWRGVYGATVFFENMDLDFFVNTFKYVDCSVIPDDHIYGLLAHWWALTPFLKISFVFTITKLIAMRLVSPILTSAIYITFYSLSALKKSLHTLFSSFGYIVNDSICRSHVWFGVKHISLLSFPSPLLACRPMLWKVLSMMESGYTSYQIHRRLILCQLLWNLLIIVALVYSPIPGTIRTAHSPNSQSGWVTILEL